VLKDPAGPDPEEAKESEEALEPEEADESSTVNAVVVIVVAGGMNGSISVTLGQASFGMRGCTLLVDLSSSV